MCLFRPSCQQLLNMGKNDGRDKKIVNKVASRKLAVTAVAGAAAVTGSIELTWPMAAEASTDAVVMLPANWEAYR
jgi:hypothetical protein